jgi:hypothetical protein
MGNTWVRNTLGFGTFRYRRFYDQKLPLLNAARSETKGLHCDSDFAGPFGSQMFIMVTTECAEGAAAEWANTFGAAAYSEKINPGDDHLPRHPARTRSATAARNGSGFQNLASWFQCSIAAAVQSNQNGRVARRRQQELRQLSGPACSSKPHATAPA